MRDIPLTVAHRITYRRSGCMPHTAVLAKTLLSSCLFVLWYCPYLQNCLAQNVVTDGKVSVVAGDLINTDSYQPPADRSRGFLLDRLSPRHLKTWQSIKQIIYSQDEAGRVLHPMLRRSYEQLQSSNHSIYIEFEDVLPRCRNCTATAGEFLIERFDPQGTNHIAVIKLYVSNIDRAVGLANSDPKTSLLFNHLRKVERYIPILAHEMAHALNILFNLERARKFQEIFDKTDPIFHRAPRTKRLAFHPNEKLLLCERDAFIEVLEKDVDIAAPLAWRELVESRGKRKVQPSDQLIVAKTVRATPQK